MGSFPDNWTQKSSNAMTALARHTVELAEEEPETWFNPTHFTTEVCYRPDKVFPPTGIQGCWEIRCQYGPKDREWTFFRQDMSNAVQQLRDCWGESIWRGHFDSGMVYEFVKRLNISAETHNY